LFTLPFRFSVNIITLRISDALQAAEPHKRLWFLVVEITRHVTCSFADVSFQKGSFGGPLLHLFLLMDSVSALEDSLDNLEEILEPLLNSSLFDITSKLDLLQKAKLQVLLPYVVNDLIFGEFSNDWISSDP